MGRPKKEIETVEISSDVTELQKKVLELQAQLDAKNAGNSAKIENYVDDNDEGEKVEISSDTYIKVMSLTPNLLTLTTQEYGRGKKFNFEKFGDVKRILYHDLADIMEQHQNFLNEGYFVILSKDVVRKHGLNDIYEKILTKESLEKIMSGNQSDAVNLFKACNDAQREFVANMFVDKFVKDETVDLNLLDRLSRVIGYSIADRAKEIKLINQK